MFLCIMLMTAAWPMSVDVTLHRDILAGILVELLTTILIPHTLVMRHFYYSTYKIYVNWQTASQSANLQNINK